MLLVVGRPQVVGAHEMDVPIARATGVNDHALSATRNGLEERNDQGWYGNDRVERSVVRTRESRPDSQ